MIVVDASIALAWVLPDEGSPATEALLARVLAERAIAPTLWWLEIANVFRTATKRARCTHDFAARALDRLHRLKILEDDETVAHAWGRTASIAREHDLSVYDATYLEVALRRSLPLATADRRLAAAAKHIGIAALPG